MASLTVRSASRSDLAAIVRVVETGTGFGIDDFRDAPSLIERLLGRAPRCCFVGLEGADVAAVLLGFSSGLRGVALWTASLDPSRIGECRALVQAFREELERDGVRRALTACRPSSPHMDTVRDLGFVAREKEKFAVATVSSRRPGRAIGAGIAVEPATPRDVDGLVEFWGGFRDSGVHLADFERRILADALGSTASLSRIARQADECAGAIVCGMAGPVAMLHHLAVAPEHRRRGVGRHLVADCFASLQDHEASLVLIGMEIDATGRDLFWERQGFRILADHALCVSNF